MCRQYYYSCKEIFLIPGIIVLLLLFSSETSAQRYEGKSFQFINVPANARQVGLGGKNITSYEKDPSMFLSNPATLVKENSNHISFNYLPYFAKTNLLNTTYTKDFKKLGTWGAAVSYINYGSFEGYDEVGEYTGNFRPSEWGLIISNAHFKNNFSFGASMKFTGSYIAGYSATALLFDLGGMFIHPEQDFRIGMTIKNVGFPLKTFNSSSEFVMPFDVMAGGSFKPEHMPLKLSVTLHGLNNFELLESEPEEKISFSKHAFSHLVIGTELIISKNINVRAGYDFLRRQQLKIEGVSGMSGFSLGGMIRVKGFEVAYSHGFFNKAGGQNCISLIADLGTLINNK